MQLIIPQNIHQIKLVSAKSLSSLIYIKSFFIDLFLQTLLNDRFLSDFDGDNFIGSSDIEHAVKLLTQNELNHEEIESVWEKVVIL